MVRTVRKSQTSAYAGAHSGLDFEVWGLSLDIGKHYLMEKGSTLW